MDDRRGHSAWAFQMAGRIVFGAGSAGRIGSLLRGLGARRLLVVTDRNLRPAAEQLVGAAGEAGVPAVVFDGGEPEPSPQVVERAVACVANQPIGAVVGLGGGSNIDVAKATAAVLSHGGRIADYAGQNGLPGPVLPIIAVPTTAGSGSEVSAACILSTPDDNSKLAVVDQRLRPAVAVVDPCLHFTCPETVTRDAGVDAFCHAIEAFTIVAADRFPHQPGVEWPVYQGKHPVSDALAERAIELIVAHLPRALARPTDLEARSGMAVGATLAGMAMSNTGIFTVHALTYPVGAFSHASHGACNGVLLPPVLDFIEGVRGAQMRRILDLMRSEREHAGDAVRDFLRQVKAPCTLAELGFPEERLDEAAEIAHGIHRLMAGSPRPTSLEQLREILQRAMVDRP